MRRQIINIRGPNAAGKTTLARLFLRDNLPPYVLGRFDGVEVKAYACDVPGLQLPVTIIGTYDTSKYSGCDKIKSADAICQAVEFAVASPTMIGHVLFEGFRVSKSWERYAALRNRLVREHSVDWLWAMLQASKELIWERSEGRREPESRPIDKAELAAVCRVMDNSRVKAKSAFPNDVLILRPEEPPAELFAQLVARVAEREAR